MTIKVLFILYFISDPDPESEPVFDQEAGVGAGVGVGTAPPRLRTPANPLSVKYLSSLVLKESKDTALATLSDNLFQCVTALLLKKTLS